MITAEAIILLDQQKRQVRAVPGKRERNKPACQPAAEYRNIAAPYIHSYGD